VVRFGEEDSLSESSDPASRLPAPPFSSRVDDLPEDFAALLSRQPLQSGDIIAQRYRLVKALGGGAMGQVFVAENLSIGRRVAVKLLRPELLSEPSFRKRFQREAEAIAAIEHRNVVRFFDLLVGDPTFLVMEYVAGPTLAEVLKAEGRLEPVRAVNIAIRLCWALDAAHRAGVVHRDVKPANVILTPDPELGEEPKLIDFGLAKLASAPAEERLTRTGAMVGTPHYMSPEQIADREVDARSDVYSLGCLLYHLLTGRPPFDQGDEVQLLYQHLEGKARPVRELVPDAPAAVEAVLVRALAKDPNARYPSMREMVEALSQIDRRRLAPPPPRRGWALWASVVMLLVALGAAAFLLRGRIAAPRTLLIISTEPAGASLELDGKPLAERSPTAAEVQAGKHVIRARLDGHTEVEQVLSLAQGQRALMELALAAQSRAVQIVSVPAGAQVFVDGHLMLGQTPLVTSLTADDFHEIRVEKPGYASLLYAVKPEDQAATLTLQLDPEREERGTLWIDANRAASVFLDGHDTGLTTPTIGVRVTPGKHTVELRDASGEHAPPIEVELLVGETRHLTLDFAKP